MMIQRLRKFIANPFSVIPLCLLIFFTTTSLNASPIASSPLDGLAGVDFSEEDLFRGIFFAQGPVAERIPSLQAFDINRFVKDAEERNQVANFQDQVVAKITKDHASFLRELKASVDSKNRYRIKETLVTGNDILLNVSSAISGQERDLNQEAEIKAALERRVDLETASAQEIGDALQAIPSDIVVPTPMFILLPVCIILFCWVILYIGMVEMQPDGLFQETLVNDIATRL